MPRFRDVAHCPFFEVGIESREFLFLELLCHVRVDVQCCGNIGMPYKYKNEITFQQKEPEPCQMKELPLWE